MSILARTELTLRALSVPGLWLASRSFGTRLQQMPSICLWRRLTGFECFGCGMGRALIAVFSGDFPAALHYHRLVFVAIGCLGAMWVGAIVEIVQSRRELAFWRRRGLAQTRAEDARSIGGGIDGGAHDS